jgi:hypothetical protein
MPLPKCGDFHIQPQKSNRSKIAAPCVSPGLDLFSSCKTGDVDFHWNEKS